MCLTSFSVLIFVPNSGFLNYLNKGKNLNVSLQSCMDGFALWNGDSPSESSYNQGAEVKFGGFGGEEWVGSHLL